MYKRLTSLLSGALMAGMFGMFLLFASALIQTGWIEWLTGTGALILIGLSLWFLNLAGGKAADADHWTELQDMQSREIIDCLGRQREWNHEASRALTSINDPDWVLRKMSATFPHSARLLADFEYDDAARAWRLKSGLYSDSFLSACGSSAPQGPEEGKLPCHEDA